MVPPALGDAGAGGHLHLLHGVSSAGPERMGGGGDQRPHSGGAAHRWDGLVLPRRHDASGTEQRDTAVRPGGTAGTAGAGVHPAHGPGAGGAVGGYFPGAHPGGAGGAVRSLAGGNGHRCGGRCGAGQRHGPGGGRYPHVRHGAGYVRFNGRAVPGEPALPGRPGLCTGGCRGGAGHLEPGRAPGNPL